MEREMRSRTMSLRMPVAAILVIIGALLSMTIGAHSEIIGLRCVNNSQSVYYTDYTVDLTAGRVSWTTSGVARSHPARITPTTIDWVEDDPPYFGGKTEYHIDRSTGFMKQVYYSSKAPKSAEYQCQRTQGF